MPEADETLTVEGRFIDNISKAMKGVGDNVKSGFKSIRESASKVTTSFKNVGKSILSLKGVLLGAGLAKAFQMTVGSAAKFESQMRQVATLSEEMSDNIGHFSSEVRKLSVTSGASLDTLTKSLYDSISAGIPAGQAMEFLSTATRLATGGATETAIAVDGLTTIINGFGLEASEASDVSDAFFVAMKFGKTTVEELSTSLGPLAPTAKAAGLGFDEMLGAVSALTKAGFETRRAVTGMQGALVAMNALTPETRKRIEGMGLATRVTGEDGATFIDVLNNISEASGGTLEGMTKLIPNIEGARAILAITSEEGKNFKDVMKLMGDRAGETAKAYAKMTDTFEFKSKKIKAGFNDAFIEVGNQLMPVMTQLASHILNNMENIKRAVVIATGVVHDAWTGVMATFEIVSSGIALAINGIMAGLAKVAGFVLKVFPKKFVPQSTIDSLKDFGDFHLEKAKDNIAEVRREATKLGENSAIYKWVEAGKIPLEAQATRLKDLTQAEKDLLGMGDKEEKKKPASTLPDPEVLKVLEEARTAVLQETMEGRIQLAREEFEIKKALLEKNNEDTLNLEKAFSNEVVKIKEQEAKKQSDIEKKETKKIAKWNKEKQEAYFAVSGAIQQVGGAMGANAKTIQKIALGEAIVQTGLAIAKANASGIYPFNIPAIVKASAVGASQIATIGSQAFAQGGFPKGRNAMVKVNEQGQESVLNARATGQLGIGGVNAMNSGQGINRNTTNQISYNPTINVSGGASDAMLDVLAQDKESFGRFIREEVFDKGY